MNAFKSGVTSVKPTDTGELKLRFTIPAGQGNIEAGYIDTPEFKISVILSETQAPLRNSILACEKRALTLLREAVERRIDEMTLQARI